MKNTHLTRWFFQWFAVGIWFLVALLINYFPVDFWWWVALGGMLDCALIAIAARSRFAYCVFPPAYFPWFLGAYAALFLFMFIDRSSLRQVWLLIILAGSILYWYRLEKWARAGATAEEEARMARIGAVWLALACSAGGIALYGWQIFVGQSAWILIFWVALLVFASTLGIEALAQRDFSSEMFLRVLILTLVALELFWAIGFTTFGFATKGIIWSSGIWYSWWLFGLLRAKETPTARVLKSTTSLLAGWLIIVILTRWF